MTRREGRRVRVFLKNEEREEMRDVIVKRTGRVQSCYIHWLQWNIYGNLNFPRGESWALKISLHAISVLQTMENLIKTRKE